MASPAASLETKVLFDASTLAGSHGLTLFLTGRDH